MSEAATHAGKVPSEHSSLWHHFDDLEHQRETTILGMWVFLARR